MEQARYVKRFGSRVMSNRFITMGHFINAMQIQVKNDTKHNHSPKKNCNKLEIWQAHLKIIQ